MFGIFQYLARDILEGIAETIDPWPLHGLHLRFDDHWLAWWRTQHPDVWSKDEIGKMLKERPPGWQQHCNQMGYPANAYPVVIQAIWPADVDVPPNVVRQHAGYPIVHETRAPAIAHTHVAAGDSIGEEHPKAPGTFGGHLVSDEGTIYLVTCAHVASGDETRVYSPGRRRQRTAPEVGIVRFASTLVPMASSDKCHSKATRAPQTTDASFAEAASTVKVSPSRTIGKVERVVDGDDVAQADKVTFHGSVSRRVDAEVGSVCLWHEIKINGKPHCFAGLFEITHPKPYYVNTDLSQPGDSGAWVVDTNSAQRGWYGILMGGNGAQSYCCYAENVLHEARASPIGPLSLP